MSLFIKPGSPEFHALTAGDFVLNGEPEGAARIRLEGVHCH